ncbi:hypothetical protein ACN47E_000634 [Coniothyrium glycines]
MARLSEEHFKSNPNIPKPERKHKGLRSVFKRGNDGNAGSPGSSNNSACVTPSPLASPTMPPGFEKVGLLPSEQSSLHSVKAGLKEESNHKVDSAAETSDAATIAKQATDSASYGKAIPTTAESPSPQQGMPSPKEERSDTPLNLLHFAKSTLSCNDGLPDRSYLHTAPAPASNALPSLRLSKRLAQTHQQEIHSWKPISISKASCSVTPADDSPPHDRRKSHASNIFDNEDELSQGIREYVASKIAEALSDHDRNQTRSRHKSQLAGAVARVTFEVNIPALHSVVNISKKNDVHDASETAQPGNLMQYLVAKGMIFPFLILVLFVLTMSAVAGPLSLLLSIWRIGVFAATYSVFVEHVTSPDSSLRRYLLIPLQIVRGELEPIGNHLKEKLSGLVTVQVQTTVDCKSNTDVDEATLERKIE